MCDFETYREQINTIKNIGDQIGYGHLMHIASALWRNSLQEKMISKDGAFVPTLTMCIKKDDIEIVQKDIDLYDMLVRNALFKNESTSINEDKI